MDMVCERQTRKGKETQTKERDRDIRRNPKEILFTSWGLSRCCLQWLQAEQRVWESPCCSHALDTRPHPLKAGFPEEAAALMSPWGGGLPSAHWLAPTSPSTSLSLPQDGGLMPAASRISTASTTQLATTCASSTAFAGTTSRAPATRCGPLA